MTLDNISRSRPETMHETPQPRHPRLEIFQVALRLGLSSFGGPVAHLGFFHREYVIRRKWIDELTYAHLVALCQFLPGPASSQVCFSIGMARGGLPGGLLAWLGFTLPSAVLMIAFGYGVNALGAVGETNWLRGLKIAAVAVVAQAVWTMAAKLCPDRSRATVALVGACVVLLWPAAFSQICIIACGGIAGWFLFGKDAAETRPVDPLKSVSYAHGVIALAVFFLLLIGLPVLASVVPNSGLSYADAFYRSGALVFGGGHVVLPLLKTAVVQPGWVAENDFLAGYGIAQALPGPLFTFAGYLGTVAKSQPNGVIGGLLCLTAIFLSPLLLLVGVMPFWENLRRQAAAQASLKGTNAAVVGVLLAAFYDPVWTSSIHHPRSFILALASFGLLVFWNCPPWLVVILAAVMGWAFL
jgi:chromate transporter